MPQSAGPVEFQLGLTMSGAISAGAYTAGVFDFLIQALDEWERAREGNLPGIDPADLPDHFVGLKVLSGASAGAITAAIGAVALADRDQAPTFFEGRPGAVKCWLPKLYEAWVLRPSLCADDGGPDFLAASDLSRDPPPEDDFSATSGVESPGEDAPRPARSLLDSRLLDAIAKSSLEVRATRAPRSYVSATLHIYLTLTNLRGVPYRVLFEGGDYHMLSHGDRVHYVAQGLGCWRSPSLFCDGDLSRRIKADWLTDGHRLKGRWKDFTICALASAAFPVGLAPRQIFARTQEYSGGSDHGPRRFRRFPNELLADCKKIAPSWPDGFGDFPFITSDGGAIDNDPFEYARFGLKDDLSQPNEPDLSRARRAVIMISPFPDTKPPRAQGQPAPGIVSIAAALVPSLIDQARFKPGELALAANPDYGSRYLISPRRYLISPGGEEALTPFAIASGLLGGFGGFVAREFRAHDFQLGRRNCQRFLQGVLAVPGSNEVVAHWPAPAKRDFVALGSGKRRAGAGSDGRDGAEPFYCVVPLLGSARDPIEPPEWARLSRAAFDRLQRRIAGRFDRLAPVLLGDVVTGPFRVLLRLALIRGPLGGIRTRALGFARTAILSDLIRRDQIEEFGRLPGDVGLDAEDLRASLALLTTLASPRKLRARLGRPQGAGPSEAAIAAALEALTQGARGACQIWKAPWRDDADQTLYVLSSCRPGFFQGLWPMVRFAIRSLRRNPGTHAGG